MYFIRFLFFFFFPLLLLVSCKPNLSAFGIKKYKVGHQQPNVLALSKQSINIKSKIHEQEFYPCSDSLSNTNLENPYPKTNPEISFSGKESDSLIPIAKTTKRNIFLPFLTGQPSKLRWSTSLHQDKVIASQREWEYDTTEIVLKVLKYFLFAVALVSFALAFYYKIRLQNTMMFVILMCVFTFTGIAGSILSIVVGNLY